MVQSMLRSIGMFIDWAVYGIVEVLFQLIMDLSNVEIFSESIIDEFSSRIYVILGLVMVFKLMISFIQMLINPDKMSDKEQGAGNLLKRVVISLALIFLVPSIFDLARQVQGEIIPLIPKVVLGTTVDTTDETTNEKIYNVGRLMAFYSFSPFFTYQNESCNDGSIMGTGADDNQATIFSVASARTHIHEEHNCSTDPDGYKYSYSWPFSTLVGAYLVYVLVSIAVAIAVRTIKLSMCELVAPIPIASYIDPKTSKQTFDKWVSTTLKTYADLFIRLIIVYFVIFVFQVLFSSDIGIMEQILANVGGNLFRKGLVVVFIIVGLLQFAKQAPKFLTDMLGLSGAGDFMGMFKGEGWKALGETGHVAENLVKAPISNWKELSNTVYADGSKPSFWRKVGSSAAGLAGVTGRTAAAIVTGKSGAELTRNPFDNTTKRRDTRIATKNRRLNGYTRELERTDKWRSRMNLSSNDDWAETMYGEYSTLANIASEAGAIGLKKGEEQDYDIYTTLDRSKGLGALFGSNNIKYSALKQIATMKEGDIWDGKVLTSSVINEASDRVKMQQKANKIDFFGQLIRKNDTAAIEVRNKYMDHFRTSPVYNDKKMVDSFADAIFKGSQYVTLEHVTYGTDGKAIITTKTYDRSEFNRKTLIDMAEYNLSNDVVQNAFKNVGEASRNEAQIKAAEAKRRNQSRKEASKS